jgi:hypothetical protein
LTKKKRKLDKGKRRKGKFQIGTGANIGKHNKVMEIR